MYKRIKHWFDRKEANHLEAFEHEHQIPNYNEDELTVNEEIPYTPFRVLGNPKKGFSIALHQYLLSNPQKTKKDALQMLETNPWPIIMNLITVMPMIHAQIAKMQAEQNKELATN